MFVKKKGGSSSRSRCGSVSQYRYAHRYARPVSNLLERKFPAIPVVYAGMKLGTLRYGDRIFPAGTGIASRNAVPSALSYLREDKWKYINLDEVDAKVRFGYLEHPTSLERIAKRQRVLPCLENSKLSVQ